MTDQHPLDHALRRVPAVGILRGCPPQRLAAVVKAAAMAGLTAVEVTLDSEEPFAGIERAASVEELVAGAGTVLEAVDVARAAEAGAQFIVSPVVSRGVIREAVRLGIPILPGAATPSEILNALEMGAHAVKVFPARELGGPQFVASVLAPLGRPRLLPTGGVSASVARSYLDAGAWAVGVGGAVFGREAMAAGDLDSISRAVAALVEATG